MKILFVNTQLSTGGIATSMLNLCKQLKNYDELEIDILLLNQNKSDIRYEIPENVNLIKIKNKYLDLYDSSFKDSLKSKNIVNIFAVFSIKIIKKIIGSEKLVQLIMKNTEKLTGYDVAISFRNDEYQYNPYAISGCNHFVLNYTDAKKKIAWIHNDPDKHGFTSDIIKSKLKDFNEIVNVSQGCKDRFDEIVPEYKYKSKLVYNTFDYDEIIEKSVEFKPYTLEDEQKVKLVTIGRISNEQKRMDRIVKVCKQFQKENINNYVWYIVGDGPNADELKKEVKEANLEDRIVFVGKKSNPFPYMKYSDAVVMTSKYEAFPMTLNEAIITGTPVITTNHISAKEIVDNGINGFISDNTTKSIYKKLTQIIKKPELLKLMRENIQENQIDKEIAINQFLDLIEYKEK